MSEGEVLTPIRQYTHCPMSGIDQIILTDRDEIILTGFRSTYFIVWNLNQDYILFRWNCGGAKRPHSFLLFTTPSPSELSISNNNNNNTMTEEGLNNGIMEEYVNSKRSSLGLAPITRDTHNKSSLFSPIFGWMFCYTHSAINDSIGLYYMDSNLLPVLSMCE